MSETFPEALSFASHGDSPWSCICELPSPEPRSFLCLCSSFSQAAVASRLLDPAPCSSFPSLPCRLPGVIRCRNPVTTWLGSSVGVRSADRALIRLSSFLVCHQGHSGLSCNKEQANQKEAWQIHVYLKLTLQKPRPKASGKQSLFMLKPVMQRSLCRHAIGWEVELMERDGGEPSQARLCKAELFLMALCTLPSSSLQMWGRTPRKERRERMACLGSLPYFGGRDR